MPVGRLSKVVYPGAVIGRLTVVEKLPKNEKGRYTAKCLCACGKEIVAEISNLSSKGTKSCGCWRDEVSRINISKAPKQKRSAHLKVNVGGRFGRLVVLSRVTTEGKDDRYVLCHCDCGQDKQVSIHSLLYNGRESCGCVKREQTIQHNKDMAKFDGFSADPATRPVFVCWKSMIDRCCNPKCTTYKDYGAKGVQVCKHLKEDPRHLMNVIGLKPFPKASLDRFPDHDGHYTCGECEECRQNGWRLNVRWASRKEQSLNRGKFNVHITAFGRTLTKSQWMELSGLGWKCLTGRIRRGWGIERALTTPDSFGNCLDTAKLT